MYSVVSDGNPNLLLIYDTTASISVMIYTLLTNHNNKVALTVVLLLLLLFMLLMLLFMLLHVCMCVCACWSLVFRTENQSPSTGW